MKLFANNTPDSEGHQIWCCSISASPDELRQIAEFIKNVANEMENKKLGKDWHKHYPEMMDTESVLAIGFPE